VGILVTEDRNVEGAGGQIAYLYQRHVPATGRFAYLLTGDRGQAEDLVQEAFVRVIGGSGIFGSQTRSRRTCAGRW
jgi:DNA-directed RNA polymerase specialized sigma24 family protein